MLPVTNVSVYGRPLPPKFNFSQATNELNEPMNALVQSTNQFPLQLITVHAELMKCSFNIHACSTNNLTRALNQLMSLLVNLLIHPSN